MQVGTATWDSLWEVYVMIGWSKVQEGRSRMARRIMAAIGGRATQEICLDMNAGKKTYFGLQTKKGCRDENESLTHKVFGLPILRIVDGPLTELNFGFQFSIPEYCVPCSLIL